MGLVEDLSVELYRFNFLMRWTMAPRREAAVMRSQKDPCSTLAHFSDWWQILLTTFEPSRRPSVILLFNGLLYLRHTVFPLLPFHFAFPWGINVWTMNKRRLISACFPLLWVSLDTFLNVHFPPVASPPNKERQLSLEDYTWLFLYLKILLMLFFCFGGKVMKQQGNLALAQCCLMERDLFIYTPLVSTHLILSFLCSSPLPLLGLSSSFPRT